MEVTNEHADQNNDNADRALQGVQDKVLLFRLGDGQRGEQIFLDDGTQNVAQENLAVCVGLFVFKINILDLLGTITGGMTSTPGLAAAASMTDSNIPSVAYATVYPIAMVFLILIIQVIASAVY